jgi:hypothetical protein
MWGARHSSRDYRSGISGTRWSFYKKLYVCEFIFSLFCVCIYLLCGKIFGEAKSSIGFELTRDRVFDVARITAFVFYQKKKISICSALSTPNENTQVTVDTWPYVPDWCTFNLVKPRWARKFCLHFRYLNFFVIWKSAFLIKQLNSPCLEGNKSKKQSNER